MPQGWPHLKTGAEQGRGSLVFLHSQLWTEVRSQGRQGPGWQMAGQVCVLQPRSWPHSLPQDQRAAEQRRVVGPPCSQWHGCCTVWGQGGQGPGWHSREQRWLQPESCLPHRSPQLCGVSQGSQAGSRSLPQ